MGLYNITEYRKAQQYVADLTKIIEILQITYVGLSKYTRYRAVGHILTTIATYLPLLEISLKEYEIVVETKGQRK